MSMRKVYGRRDFAIIGELIEPGTRVLDGRFTVVQQAVATPRGREEAAIYLREFVEDMKMSGFVAETMAVYLATGLRRGQAQPEDDEVIYKRLVPLPAAVRMAVGSTIKDAKTIASVLWLDHMARTANSKRA